MEVNDLKALAGDDWGKAAQRLATALKKELQGTNGLIRAAKVLTEQKRKMELAAAIESMSETSSLTGLDAKINHMANNFFEINQRYQLAIIYDHFDTFTHTANLAACPITDMVLSFAADASNDERARRRATAVLASLVNQSESQSNRTNAGVAGENIARAILRAAGLKKDVHYREQYKSDRGSDTDFALPYIPDRSDHLVEMLIAVQMSSNDRTRLSTSEIKQGAVGFLVTGNGMDASKKRLIDIGIQIIASQRSNNIRMACYGPELKKEIERCDEHISEKRNVEEMKIRRDYFQNYAINFEQFAERLKVQFGAR